MEQKDLQHIANQFEITGTVAEVKPLGNGLINTTYKVTTAEADAPDYVLQHINNAIFPDVDMLMNNIVAVTTHIRKSLKLSILMTSTARYSSSFPAKTASTTTSSTTSIGASWYSFPMQYQRAV